VLNFDTYQPLRINEAPHQVHLVSSTLALGGIGEPGTARTRRVTNAIFAATGKRLRKLPVDPPS
jgi:isoquinoline 1-oxidoreductase beta subunit